MTVTTTPAPARTDRIAGSPTATGAPADPAAPTRRGGSRPLAGLLIAAPLLLLGSILLHPDDTHGVEHTLEAVGGAERVLWSAVHLVEPAAWLLLGVTLLLALPRMAGERGRRPLTVAGVLVAIGFPAIALIVYGHGEAFAFMASTDVAPQVYAPLFERFETAMPLAALPSLLGRLGLLVAAAGLLRARTVPVWAALALVVPALALGSTSGLPMAIGLGIVFAPLLVVLGLVARRVATTGGPALGARA